MVGEGRRLATELVVINASAIHEMYARAGTRALAAGAAAGSPEAGRFAAGSTALTLPPPSFAVLEKTQNTFDSWRQPRREPHL
jgi:hypothetical protein